MVSLSHPPPPHCACVVVVQRKLDFLAGLLAFCTFYSNGNIKMDETFQFETRFATTQRHVQCATKLCCLLFPFLSHCTVPLQRVHSTTTNPASLPPTSQGPLFHHHHHTGGPPSHSPRLSNSRLLLAGRRVLSSLSSSLRSRGTQKSAQIPTRKRLNINTAPPQKTVRRTYMYVSAKWLMGLKVEMAQQHL